MSLTTGIIVINEHEALFAVYKGNTAKIIHEVSSEIPSKDPQGDSLLRHARKRLDKRNQYLATIKNTAAYCFLQYSREPNIDRLVIAGESYWTDILRQHCQYQLAPELEALLPKIMHTCGGLTGLTMAIAKLKDHNLESQNANQTPEKRNWSSDDEYIG